MDNDFKWLAIMIVGIAIATAIGGSIANHNETQLTIQMASHGYVEKMVDGRKMWVKAETDAEASP